MTQPSPETDFALWLFITVTGIGWGAFVQRLRLEWKRELLLVTVGFMVIWAVGFAYVDMMGD